MFEEAEKTQELFDKKKTKDVRYWFPKKAQSKIQAFCNLEQYK